MQGQVSRLMAQPLIMSSICIEYTHERVLAPKIKRRSEQASTSKIILEWVGGINSRELYTDFLFPTFVHIYEQLDEASLS